MGITKEGMNVASFFSGAGGFDLGFKQAGFKIVLANDNWKPAAETFRRNFPETHFIEQPIEKITKKQIDQILRGKKAKKIDIVIGGPPCQCFTRLNNNNLNISDKRRLLFHEYMRMIKILKPKYVVMENVADLLVRKNEKGQYFKDLIIEGFKKLDYQCIYNVFETERYGIPQKRRRAIFLATSKDIEITFPQASSKISVIKQFLIKLKKYKNLSNNEITENGPYVLKRIQNIPAGGYYEQLPDHLKVKKVRNGKLVIVKRYGSYFRRLSNNEPSITITNNYLIHPTKDRYLTNREMAILHTFPPNFEFFGGREAVAQQIANAVPPEFARRIASHIKDKLGF